MEQHGKRGGLDATVGYESQRPIPSPAPAPEVSPGSPRLPADLAATYVDLSSPGGLHATMALGATIAAPLPLVTDASSAQSREHAMTLSILPRLESAGDELRLVPTASEPRYRTVRALGEGGMGEVALVEDRDIGRTVALKRLRDQGGHAAALVARFVDEVRTTGRLEHPNIVPIHDVGVDEHGNYFFVMKFVDGDTLETIIEKLRAGDPEARRVFGMQRRIEIFVGLLRALQYAHARGIVHRDVKPANVMIGRFGEVVLMDWGVARPMGSIEIEVDDLRMTADVMRAAPSRASETHHGALIGTPLYMSPEQAAGLNDTLDARSDLYSACVVFHELLGLRHLREASSSSLGSLLEAIRRDEAPSAFVMFGGHASNPQGVPPELAHFLHRGLALAPGRRWQSADEMILELEGMLEGRNRVQCPATLIKRFTREIGRAIDRRPRIASMSLYFAAFLVFAMVALAVRDLVS